MLYIDEMTIRRVPLYSSFDADSNGIIIVLLSVVCLEIDAVVCSIALKLIDSIEKSQRGRLGPRTAFIRDCRRWENLVI